MTVQRAKELLGKEAEGKSDEEIERDIEMAKFFVDTFIDMVREGKIKLESKDI